ncbi:uncharacterized protein LOC135834605 [Planococcus citri]|uniref:uncharacterized protein LOC135834605 n=1 Tax=Planococcus citri TaxID=170843 RepID=UPI0031F83A0C
MAVIKNVCCLSLRTGTLFLLYVHLISNVWSVMSNLTSYGDTTFNKYIGSNPPLFYTNLFLSVIGGLIFLATIISISNGTPSNSLLSTDIAFLVLGVVYGVYETVQINLDDSFRELYNEAVNEEAHKLRPEDQEEFLNLMNSMYGSVLAFVCFIVFIGIAFTIYSILVFHSYNTEVKKNIGNGMSFRINNSGVTNSSAAAPPAYSSQYPGQFPQYFVEVDIKK